ncbi:MAG: helix-turn-helix domain-containing protein [Lysobacterales bacterium]|nr:MAG: helix-turn-helix domain-containing protein [Xanthomonadales bacterium]
MEIRPIKTEHDYEQALARVSELMGARPGSDEEDELEVLSILVDSYEEKHFPIDLPDPIDAILFRIEQQGLTRKDLEPLLGSRHRVSEVLNRKRGLSLQMIQRLHEQLGIPLETLIGRAA